MKSNHFFNLLELSLAIAMSTIGIAAILGMLPMIVTTSAESTADNYVSQAASIVMSELEQEIRLNDTTDISTTLWTDSNITSLIKATNFYNLQTNYTTSYTTESQDTSGMQDNLDSDATYKIDGTLSSGSFKIYLGRKGETPSFGARVTVWRNSNGTCVTQGGTLLTTQSGGLAFATSNGSKVSSSSGGGRGSSSSSSNVLMLSRLLVKLEWPLDVPSARRQTRTFVKEWMSPVYRYPAGQSAR